MNTDERYMLEAIKQAEKSRAIDEVPVGAVIVKDDKIIARAHNIRETSCDATGHAEIVAIRKAGKKLSGWRLTGCTLYVTLEPCAMCSGAIINARVDRVVFGAYDPKGGCCGSLYHLPADPRFNHRPEVEGGILREKCADLLSSYFKEKRRK